MFVSLGVNESPERERVDLLSPSLFDLALFLSPFTPWGVVYRRAIYFLRFANGFPRLGFVFLPIYSLYRIFISRVKIAKGNVKEGTGSCPKDPAGYGKNGYFVVLHRVHRVGGCICWFCDGFVIWLPWWLIDVSHSFSHRRIFASIFALFCFLFFFFFSFCFASGCYQPEGVCLCVYRVLIVERLGWLICSAEWFF